MIARVAVAIFITVLLGVPAPSNADPKDPPPPKDTTSAGSGSSSYWIGKVREQKIGRTTGRVSGTSSSGSGAPSGPTIVRGRATCVASEVVPVPGSSATPLLTICDPAPSTSGPAVTVGLIRTAFAELKLPAGTLVIQPPDGLTLVNFDTNFYTTSTQPISRTVTLLGQSVTLEATPATFIWTFGDGQSMATDIPGRPYPKLDITHNYLRTGTYLPSLSTTYTGRFRVAGGPWRQIPGTVTIDGTGQSLRAIEAQPKLVGY